MQFQEVEQYADYLFTLALKKTANFADAQDLTQDVLLAALEYKHEIQEIKPWLGTVLNRKYYDLLRKKYKLPIISIDQYGEAVEPFNPQENDDQIDSELIRREVAFLADKYRCVIVRHYLQGEKVNEIAKNLGLPKGTVLSRLSTAREQIKKGFNKMESYEKLSYQPEILDIGCNGRPGLNDEPFSLVKNNLLKQNILIFAYEKPVTSVQIAKGLGIPTAYIEEAINDLVNEELLTKLGNKLFTDFIITSPEDKLKGLDSQINFVEKNYEDLKKIIENYIDKIRNTSVYNHLEKEEQKKLEHYFALHLFSAGIYTCAMRLLPSNDEFPQRPNGGAWVAIGNRYPKNFDFNNFRFTKYCFGGERRAYWENCLGTKSIHLRIYDTQPDLNKYEHGPVKMSDGDLAKLLCLIYKGIPIEHVGLEPLLLKNISHLCECNVLKLVDNKPRVSLPIINSHDYSEIDNIRKEEIEPLANFLEPLIKEMLPQLKIPVPKHLENRIAPLRQYSFFSIPMAFMKKAVENNDNDITGSTPPMLLVIDELNGITH